MPDIPLPHAARRVVKVVLVSMGSSGGRAQVKRLLSQVMVLSHPQSSQNPPQLPGELGIRTAYREDDQYMAFFSSLLDDVIHTKPSGFTYKLALFFTLAEL